ncbi:MAG TPA: hypothetical protein P5055_04370, partial [Candidatus Paceibacterota bacterium]|nr:hypothetical protein [Candidatus Paceibacterota bacterium]
HQIGAEPLRYKQTHRPDGDQQNEENLDAHAVNLIEIKACARELTLGPSNPQPPRRDWGIRACQGPDGVDYGFEALAR